MEKMLPLMMDAAGYRLITATYTGLGEREHLANSSNDLETHVQDLLNVIKYEDLGEIVLVGHSYGGIVATAVADRMRGRIEQLIYHDAFVPQEGQACLDLIAPEPKPRMLESVKAGDGWRVPPNPLPSDTSEADVKWIAARRLPQSFKCFEMPLRLLHGEHSRFRAVMCIALVSHPGTSSARSRKLPKVSLGGATTRWMPAIRRTSQRPKIWPLCSTPSFPNDKKPGTSGRKDQDPLCNSL